MDVCEFVYGVCVCVYVCACFSGCGGLFEVLACCVCVWSDILIDRKAGMDR